MFDRKPTTKMESRTTRTFRLKASEEEEFRREALDRGIGWTTFVRDCALIGLDFVRTQEQMKSRTRITA